MSTRRGAPAESFEAEQSSLFDPIPCQVCGEAMEPHWLPNYDPPEWVAACRVRCGDPIYAPTRETLVMEWNFAHRCDCGRAFPTPYWSDREKCDRCLLPSRTQDVTP